LWTNLSEASALVAAGRPVRAAAGHDGGGGDVVLGLDLDGGEKILAQA
jgi:hypothetical protein